MKMGEFMTEKYFNTANVKKKLKDLGINAEYLKMVLESAKDARNMKVLAKLVMIHNLVESGGSLPQELEEWARNISNKIESEVQRRRVDKMILEEDTYTSFIESISEEPPEFEGGLTTKQFKKWLDEMGETGFTGIEVNKVMKEINEMMKRYQMPKLKPRKSKRRYPL